MPSNAVRGPFWSQRSFFLTVLCEERTFKTCSTVSFMSTLRRRTLKEVYAWEPSRKLGVMRPPYELELAFQTPNELKIPNFKFKSKVKAHGKGKLEPNQNDVSDNFLSTRRLHTGPSPCSTGARPVGPASQSQVKNYSPEYMEQAPGKWS